MNPKYPEVNVQLVGEDGNAFSILGRVTRAMSRAGIVDSEVDAFRAEATSGDYDNLLRTVLAWVNVDGLGDESDEDSDEERGAHACYECDNPYAVGGCPECGAWHE